MRSLMRIVAVVVPMAVVLGGTGTAMAKPKVAPPVLTQKPANPTNSTSATFAWTETTASVTFTCQLDGVKAACTSPKSYTGLKPGSHSFQVKGNRSGYISGSTSYSWTVKTAAPNAPVVAQVPTPTNQTSASVTWTESTAGVTFTCKLDSGTAAACTSPKNLTGLAEGSHTLTVTARDAAGNTASGSTTWVIDLTPPGAPVVTGPASPTKSTSASVTWTGTGTSYSCKVDNLTPATCTSPLNLSGLAEGAHAVVVTAKDAVGNVSEPGTALWVVDTTPPAAPTIVSSPASPTNPTSAPVRFDDVDQTVATYTCQLDSGTVAACTSPWTGTVTTNAPHTLTVIALDAATNPSTPSVASWTVDSTAPTPPVISAGPGTPSNDGNPAFTFASGDAGTVSYTCSLDDGTALPCVSGATFAVSAQGPHHLAVRALDSVPNTSAPAIWNWVYDTVAPAAPTATTPTTVPVSKTPPAVGFGSSDPTVASFTCQVDAGTAAACTSPFTPGAVADGTHTVKVRAVDGAGNVGAPLTFTFSTDTVAPTASFTAPISVARGGSMTFSEDVLGATPSTVRLSLGGTQLAATLVCRSASSVVVPCTGAVRSVSLTPTRLLVPGQHYAVSVTSAVHDAAGNAAVVTPAAFRGALVQQESSSALAQSWRVAPSAAALGGRYIVSDTAGARASFPFRGTSITWYGNSGPSYGVARVYVDGVNKGLVNTYAATAKYRVPHTITGLSGGGVIHRLQIVPTGVKGAVSGTGALVAFDAVKLGTTTVTNPVSTNTWGRFASTPSSGGGYASEDQANAVTVMAFRGTSITWTTVTGTTMGKAQVWIDNVLKATYDNYATATHYGVTRTLATTDGVHTVKVVVLGTHRAGAKGNRVVLDALTVG